MAGYLLCSFKNSHGEKVNVIGTLCRRAFQIYSINTDRINDTNGYEGIMDTVQDAIENYLKENDSVIKDIEEVRRAISKRLDLLFNTTEKFNDMERLPISEEDDFIDPNEEPEVFDSKAFDKVVQEDKESRVSAIIRTILHVMYKEKKRDIIHYPEYSEIVIHDKDALNKIFHSAEGGVTPGDFEAIKRLFRSRGLVFEVGDSPDDRDIRFRKLGITTVRKEE